MTTTNNLLLAAPFPFHGPRQENLGALGPWLQLELFEGNTLRTYSLFME